MAYNVSNDYRTVVYSGEALYNCRLKINNTLVPTEQISSIKISSPIIDTTTGTGSMFHIGTFISQKLDIKFKNLDGLTLTNNPNIELEIGLKIGNSYEYVPIGKYLIDELGENYQKTCEITCMDYAIKFKSNLDISQFFNQQDYIYASDLFERICNYYGIAVGTYPNVNNNKKIYVYDNSLTGKDYIMYLAELFGGNAKIERDGSCSIIPLKNYTDIEIDALTSKKFEVGDTYELSRVCYDNGKNKYQAPNNRNVISVDLLPISNIDLNSYYYLTTDMKYYRYINNEWQQDNTIKNTLYIKTDNLFITQQSDIDNIYNAVQNFSVTNITCENRIDLSLDCWDIVKYNTTNGNYYYTFYNNTIKFNGTTMGKVEVNIPLKTTEETTNIITANNDAKFRKIQTTVDEQNLAISTTVSLVERQNTTISRIDQKVDEINAKISDIADITVTAESNSADIELNRVNESEPILLKVHPIGTNISKLYPRTNLYPATNLYMTIRKIRFIRTYTEEGTTHTENIDYELPDDLLYYDSENYDEFSLDYDSQICQVTKKCKYNADGTVGLLATPIVNDYDYPTISLGAGNYEVQILSYSIGYIKATLMAENIYTTQFYTKVQTDSQIEQKADEITSSVTQTLTGYATKNELNTNITSLSTRIKQTAKTISLTATDNNTSAGINIRLYNEDGTQIDSKDANITMSGLVKFTDLSTSGSTTINGSNITTGVINANLITTGNLSANRISGGSITASSISLGNGKFAVTTQGALTATSGTIGGFTLASTSFSKSISGIYNYNLFDKILVAMDIMNRVTLDAGMINVLDANDSGTITASDYTKISNIINGTTTNTKSVNGTFEINSNNTKNCVNIKDNYGNLVVSLGLGGINATNITGGNCVIGIAGNTFDSSTYVAIDGTEGNLFATGTITQGSLESLKKDFEKFENGLDIINNIDIYKYNYKKEKNDTKKHIGFVIGNNFKYSEEITSNNNDGVDLYSFVSVCCKAIQEQQEEIEQLQERIKLLEER